MKLVTIPRSILWFLCVPCGLCGLVLNCLALDREAFTFTKYDLNIQIDPQQHRIGVRGKITLRNDSPAPQKIAVLQISSSLDWLSIKASDKALQFVSQPYTSDIDHTGGLAEAIVTLPQPVPPKGTIDLDIGYEGVIVLDATRLTRIGTPEDAATSTDWDQIAPDFTAVRGAGYVAWYPIATESANLSDGNELFDVLGRWKAREAGSEIRIEVIATMDYPSVPQILFDGLICPASNLEATSATNQRQIANCPPQNLRLDAPTLLIGANTVMERPAIDVRFLPGHEGAASRFADAAEQAVPLIRDWFGPPREKARVVDLPVPNAAPFECGALLLTPLANTDSKLASLAAAHQLTHASFLSFRPWINEGLAHFAQALYLEHERNRPAALDYMGLHRSAFIEAEKSLRPEEDTGRSLVNTASEELYRSKAMCVWWMLRDMIGDAALKKALAAYRAEDDKDPAYMQRLIAAQTSSDLQWFFDDWVYHDRGLPDFKVESAFARKATTDTFMVAVTVANLGTAGAEVPVIVKFAGGEVTKRLAVRAKSKATIRVEVPAVPREIVVNDGSVPECDMTNNVFRIQAADAAK